MHPNPRVAFFMGKCFDPVMYKLFSLITMVEGDSYFRPTTTNVQRIRKAVSSLLMAVMSLVCCLPPTLWMEYHDWAPRSTHWAEARIYARHAIQYLKEIRL